MLGLGEVYTAIMWAGRAKLVPNRCLSSSKNSQFFSSVIDIAFPDPPSVRQARRPVYHSEAQPIRSRWIARLEPRKSRVLSQCSSDCKLMTSPREACTAVVTSSGLLVPGYRCMYQTYKEDSTSLSEMRACMCICIWKRE